VTDLDAVAASMSGKVEVESLDEDRDAEILERIVRSAVLAVFREQVPGETHRAIVEAFDEHEGVAIGEDLGSAAYAVLVDEEIPALRPAVDALLDGEEDTGPAVVASAVELVLEGLHLSKRLNKHTAGPRSRYQART
jgi:magnesium chelatase subunit I